MAWLETLDNAIATVAPRWAARRAQYRMAAAYATLQARKYDGATTGRRSAGWRPTSTDANAELQFAAGRLRDNARDLERNNAWAHKGLSAIVANTVGTGIRAQVKGPNAKRTKRSADAWRTWAETPACDYDGRNDLYGLQALVMRSVARDGEVLVRRRRVAGALPVKLQVLEVDFLDTSKGMQGVEVDDIGTVKGYWLFERHPGSIANGGAALGSLFSTLVPAEQVAHVYDQTRAGQLRAASWFAPVVLPLRDLDDYEDAQLIRQKIAACFSVFVYDSTGADMLGADPSAAALPERLEPGIIETLPAGKDIRFAAPPGVDGYSDYVRSVLHKIAAGLGITYEALTGDLSQTNFSSGRMGWLEFQRNLEAWRWRMLIPQFCVFAWETFGEGAAIAGVDMAGIAAEWTAPRRELINPLEETRGMVAEIRGGLSSWSEAVRERGFDPDALINEIAADAKRFDALGLVLDCDPRHTTQQGQPTEKPAPGKD